MKTTPVLKYHEQPAPGKFAIVPTKPCRTKEDLALAYTPGVAEPCLVIQKDPTAAYRFTTKGNAVAVISNGTSVLGLGDIGALAGKPVMEGKAVLFKRFAGIDATDLEVAEKDPEKLADVITAVAPTFGGINLEDIKAPECFVVERLLRERLDIPVFHDDQHGTAVVVAAGVLNALYLTKRSVKSVKVVFSGAGAAAIAIATMLVTLGIPKGNIWLFDSHGLVTTKRADLNEYKRPFAQSRDATLPQALVGADLFVGVSKGNLLTPEMLQSMAPKPIIFALANPTPEIPYDVARKAVPGAIVATGRSDFPNQVNNVLCFPFLFRGALDVRASTVSEGMKRAAAEAIAMLARKPVPVAVQRLYHRTLAFGPEYLIPVPFDPRLLPTVASAVAQAAMREGVAREKISLPAYRVRLAKQAARLAKGKFC